MPLSTKESPKTKKLRPALARWLKAAKARTRTRTSRNERGAIEGEVKKEKVEVKEFGCEKWRGDGRMLYREERGEIWLFTLECQLKKGMVCVSELKNWV